MLKRYLIFSYFLLLAAGNAHAHPLGTLSINHYSRLDLAGNAIWLHYLLDMAEIPTLQEMQRLDRDGDGTIDEAERQTYLQQMLATVAGNLQLWANGTTVDLQLQAAHLELLPGDGNLQTLLLSGTFRAALPDTAVITARYRDDNFRGRLGWREIVVRAHGDTELLDSTAPAKDVSQGLRYYPDGQLLDVREAVFTFKPGSRDAKPVLDSPRAAPEPEAITNGHISDRAFTGLLRDRAISVPFLLFAIIAAIFWGAVHALAPGHGKSVVAAYLIGNRGTVRHALQLGLLVTLTHTAGVFVLGLVTLFASRYLFPETLYPWLSLLAGLLITGLGFYMLLSRRRMSHRHAVAGHTHGHAVPAGTAVSWKSLLPLGLSSGIVPCISGLVVLLSAVSLNRVGFGVLLLFAFSLGLGLVLAGTGVLIVLAGRYFDRINFNHPALQVLPVLSAVVIIVVGLLISRQAFAMLDI